MHFLQLLIVGLPCLCLTQALLKQVFSSLMSSDSAQVQVGSSWPEGADFPWTLSLLELGSRYFPFLLEQGAHRHLYFIMVLLFFFLVY